MLTKDSIKAMVFSSAKILQENEQILTDIDAKFGDADHGITIAKIAQIMSDKTNSWDSESIKEYFVQLGTAVLAVKGGSAGPLYGTMLGGFGECLDGTEQEIDPKTLKAMFASSLAEMQFLTTAKIGDKTMMDSLIPAVEAVQNADDNIESILEAASLAAMKGAKESENFISKFGRAKSYKEQTLGTPDAGAVSTSLFIQGFAKGYTK